MCSKFCVKKMCVAFNVLQTIVGCLIGIAGFIAFFFVFKNYHAALWGLASAVFAACCLHLHLLYLRKKLQDWYTNRQLESIQSFGLVIFLASVVTFGVYISLAIVKQQRRQDGKHLKGVGLLLSRHTSDALLGYDCINESFLTAKFRKKIKDLNVICCYAPTEDSDENEKDTFYSQLQDILNFVEKGDISLVLGDFNAKVGTDSDLWAGVLGPFGIGSSNGNGERSPTGYTLEGFSYYPASTFTALNLYWSFNLFSFCHCYQRKITASNPALLSGVKVHPDSDVES